MFNLGKDEGLLILLRHGESEWNRKNIFTGWIDIPLSQKGIEEAMRAGEALRGIAIDEVFTSVLIRAILTAFIAMGYQSSGKIALLNNDENRERLQKGDVWVPVTEAWQLNERKYGELEGMNKDEMRTQYGVEQVHIWRRSYEVAPPGGESLKMTLERTLPYFFDAIVPRLRGKKVLVTAHGNSLRAITKAIDGLSDEEVVALEIPTGLPLFYRYKEGQFQKL